MSVTANVHMAEGFEVGILDCLNYETPFVSVHITPEGHGPYVSILCSTPDQAEIVGLEFLKAAKMIREHQALKNSVTT